MVQQRAVDGKTAMSTVDSKLKQPGFVAGWLLAAFSVLARKQHRHQFSWWLSVLPGMEMK